MHGVQRSKLPWPVDDRMCARMDTGDDRTLPFTASLLPLCLVKKMFQKPREDYDYGDVDGQAVYSALTS